MLPNFLPLLFAALISAASLTAADCRCGCTIFKTLGGTRALCETEPEPGRYSHCTDWRYLIPNIYSKAKCVELERRFHPCTGYRMGQFPTDKWIYSTDGELHTCRFM